MPSRKRKKVGANESISWSAPEFLVYERGMLWYLIAGVIFAAGELLAVLVMRDPLTAVLLAISAVVLLFHHRMEPRVLDYSIGQNSILIGESEYHRNQLKSFWFSYEPWPQMHLEIKGRALPIIILLNEISEDDVRQAMRELAPEDTGRQEDLLSKVVRTLKL